MTRSITFWVRFQKLFTPSKEDRFAEAIAALTVLYEDLRVELHCLTEKNLAAIDALIDHQFRVIYFLRRSILTLDEFSAVARCLEKQQRFQRLQISFTEEEKRKWDRSLNYLARLKKYKIRDIRNDVAGHFGLKAATRAIEMISSHPHPDPRGKIEMRIHPGSHEKDRVLYLFASILAEWPISYHRPPKVSKRMWPRIIRKRLELGFFHCGRIMRLLQRHYYRPRLD